MSGMFSVSMPDFKKWGAMMEKTLRQSMAQVANDCAFEFRSRALDALAENMTIRNPSLVRKAVSVGEKARPSNGGTAQVGTLKLPGFTGWTEQQTGAPGRRRKTPTLFARGGKPKAVIPKKNRVMPENRFFDPAAIAAPPGGSRLSATFEQAFREQGMEGRVILNSPEGDLPAGIWAPTGDTFERNGRTLHRFRVLQLFNRKPKEAKRLDIVSLALKAIPEDFIKKSFAKHLAFYLEKNAGGKR